MFCEQCGNKLQPTFKFCNSCGSSIGNIKSDSEKNAYITELLNENVKLENSIGSNTDLKNFIQENEISLTKLIILNFATAGVYYYIYAWHLQKLIDDKFHPEKRHIKILLAWAGLISWSIYIQILFGADLIILSALLLSISIGFFIYWELKVKKILEDNMLYKFHVNIHLNTFYTIIFGIFYFCYCINDLENIKKRDDYLKSVRA